jgi:ribosomal protein S9
MVNPLATDSGTLPNLRFSFADALVRQSSGGWTRQVTARELGISTAIAGANMRPRASLAQAGGMGLHALRNGPHHRDRPAGP